MKVKLEFVHIIVRREGTATRYDMLELFAKIGYMWIYEMLWFWMLEIVTESVSNREC